MHFINQVYLDKVFLNVVGLDVERGATTLEADEAVIFRAMQRQAREVIAVADHTKLGQVSSALICPVQEIQMLVTDTGATDAMIAPFEERGIKVLRVADAMNAQEAGGCGTAGVGLQADCAEWRRPECWPPR